MTSNAEPRTAPSRPESTLVPTAGDQPSALDAMLDLGHPIKKAAEAWARSHPCSGDGFDRRWWSEAADAGLLGVVADPSLGGVGASHVASLLMFEGLGRATNDVGMVFALASQVYATQTALAGSASDQQRAEFLVPLIQGRRIGCFAMTEPDAGSDPAAITTTARRVGQRWQLDGTKTWLTLGPVADVALVFATVDPNKGAWGITAFLVPLDTPGVTVSDTIAKSGLQSCPFGSLTLNGVEVDDDHRLGGIGAGMTIFSRAVEAERAFLYAAQLGVMERLIDRTVDRARSRRQGGNAIGHYQAVSHRLADMKLQHESARLLVYKAGALADRGQSVAMAAALAKLSASEYAVTAAIDAMRTHGAEGYTVAAGLEQDVRDALAGLAYSGTSDVQKNIVARLLGVDRPLRAPNAEKVVS